MERGPIGVPRGWVYFVSWPAKYEGEVTTMCVCVHVDLKGGMGPFPM